jgi:nucleoside-triphosphatase THEP1
MPNYDFKSLSDRDFEELTSDLLQKEFGVLFESFKRGRDGGIDLRHSTAKSGNIIVQCKHLASSSFSSLKRAVTAEVQKIKLLKPKRYIFVTSQGLTPHNKKVLKSILSPFCKKDQDILGQDDLNNLLGRHSEVEKIHYKLWLTSIPILQEILRSEVTNLTRMEVEHIKNKVKLYVQNDSFLEANKKIRKNHFLIISGIPGIGKTTLAEMLLLQHLNQGYSVYKITDNIKKAFELFDIEKPQLFYYDDFLGKTSLAEKLGKNEDELLKTFINHVIRSKNKRLILTTREYILKQAKQTYERLADNSLELAKYIVDLSKYTPFIKAKILYNHLYFYGVPKNYITALLKDKFYIEIIEHDNFSPRLIEFMSQRTNFHHIKPKDYQNFFLTNLQNPTEIWRHVFESQIDENSRRLLICLFMEGGWVDESVLSILFHRMKQTGGKSFRQCLKELEGTFIVIDEHGRTEFHNPSLIDFIQNYISTDATEYIDLGILHCTNLEQLQRLWWQTHKGIKNFGAYRKAMKKFILKPIVYSFENPDREETGCNVLYPHRLELLLDIYHKSRSPAFIALAKELCIKFSGEYWVLEEYENLYRCIELSNNSTSLSEEEKDYFIKTSIKKLAAAGIHDFYGAREKLGLFERYRKYVSSAHKAQIKKDFIYFIDGSQELKDYLGVQDFPEDLWDEYEYVLDLAGMLNIDMANYRVEALIEERINRIHQEEKKMKNIEEPWQPKINPGKISSAEERRAIENLFGEPG